MKTKMVFAALATLMMAGCSNETDEQLMQNGRTPLQVKGGVVMHEVTRALNNSWEAGDAIGIYTVNPDNAIVEDVKNYRYVTAAGDGNFSASGATAYLPIGGNSVTVKAYYPQGNVDSDNLYSIDLTQQSKQAAIDLMTAQCEGVNKDKPAATLNFSHKLTKVVLNITAQDVNVEGLQVKISNQKPTVKYNVLTGALAAEGEAADIVLNFNGSNTAEAILAPNSDENPAAERIMTFALNGNEYTTAIPADVLFETGTKISYNVNFKLEVGSQTEMEISGATIDNWAEGPQTEDVEIVVKPEEAPKALYMMGNSCGAGWFELANGIEMPKQEDGTYKVEGIELSTGAFKFATRNYDYTETLYWYAAGVEADVALVPDQEMSIQLLSNKEDTKSWSVSAETAGIYTLVIDIENLTLTATKIGNIAKKLYLIGDGCDAGWDLGNGVAVVESDETGVFKGKVNLKEGTIKIAQRNDLSYGSSDLKWYMPVGGDASFTPGTPMDMQEVVEGSGTDCKWTITAAGTYDLTIDANAMQMSATLVTE